MIKLYFKKLLFGLIYFGVFIAIFAFFGPFIMVMGLSLKNTFLSMIAVLVPPAVVIASISFRNRTNNYKMSKEYLKQLKDGKTDMRKYLRSLPDIRMEALAFAIIEVVVACSAIIIIKLSAEVIVQGLFMFLGFFIAFVAIDLLVWALVLRKWEWKY